MKEKYFTTTYDNIRGRAIFLTQQGGKSEEAGPAWNKAAEFAFALCEEIDRLKEEIKELKGAKP